MRLYPAASDVTIASLVPPDYSGRPSASNRSMQAAKDSQSKLSQSRLSLDRIVDDPAQSAKSAGLRYVTDTKPGIRRLRRGKSFRYVDAESRPIRDQKTIARIKSLVIPPAWNDVWICPIPNGHLQVTGRDARGRKQSRYHSHWREVRDETKYERMLLFGSVLPSIRQRIEQDLTHLGMPREKILAAIIRLMETTYIRIGNEEYARNNHSYGLTTMRDKHVNVNGYTVHFEFPGKSGIKHSIDLHNRRMARVIRECLDLPGYELFQYVDETDARHSIDSADVNNYLSEIAGDHFTTKDFRTWAGSLLACATLQQFEPFTSEAEAKKNIVAAIKCVAHQLGNTPPVCRKCYVHPAILEQYLGGRMTRTLTAAVKHDPLSEDIPADLRKEEQALLRLLRNPVAT
jgi:DNA topoisomerase-1